MASALQYENSHLVVESDKLEPGTVAWKSPSNLALVKYWGKHGVQLPRNPSVSFTLDASHTYMEMSYEARQTKGGVVLDFFFEGKENAPFGEKIKRFLETLIPVFPFLEQVHLTIRSSNSFPHSAGIASSASSMSALALCLCSMEDRLFKTLELDTDFRQKASYIARLGSGSASRSIYSRAALWGQWPDKPEASDLYAIPVEDLLHPVFKTFKNDILIVSQGEKSVSSSAGHELMENNNYAPVRYQQAGQNLRKLMASLQQGDLETFGQITESEALTLHALMMTGNPSYILMRPNSLEAIERVRQFRKETGTPLYFSLDAGPNLHLLYPEADQPKVRPFIDSLLKPLCEGGKYIADRVGDGPTQEK